MNRKRAITPLTGRISSLMPALAALTLGWTGLTAHASVDAARAEIQAELQSFANDRAVATGVAPTTLAATADDLVYAVYQASLGNPTAYTLPELVQAALDGVQVGGGTPTRVRTDLATVAGRVVGAAIVGGDLENNGAAAVALVSTAANINIGTANPRLELTAAGREFLISRALETTVGQGTALGNEAAVLGAGSDPSLQAFAEAALRPIGTATGDVDAFTHALLESVSAANRNAVATNLAVSLATNRLSPNPMAAGGVIAGRAEEIAADDGAAANGEIQSLIGLLLNNRGLSRVVSNVVGGAAASYTGDKDALAAALIGGLNARTVTTALKGQIASGFIQSFGGGVTQTQVNNLINTIYPLDSTRFTNTNGDLVTFAAFAALNTGDSAGLLENTILSKLTSPLPAVLTALGSALVRSVAASSPASAQVIAANLINNGGAAFTADSAKQTLAIALVRAVPTNGLAAGAAAEGVGSTLDGGTPTLESLVTLAKGTVAAASRVGANITMDLAALIPAVHTTDDFATALAGSGLNAAFVPAATAGIGSADPFNAAQIAKDVINLNTTLQARAFSIATTVAANVDVEHVADIAEKVSSLLSNRPVGSRLPALSTIGTLGYDLAHVINTLPLVPTANRADEIGEVAAALTNAVIANPPAGTDAATVDRAYVAIIDSIATNIFRALSARQLANGGFLMADKKDELQDIVGSIAQSISVSSLDPAIKAILLDNSGARGSLYAGLRAAAAATAGLNPPAARAYLADVATAFANVLSAGIGNVYVDPNPANNEKLANGQTGKYEVGNFYDPETQFQNPL